MSHVRKTTNLAEMNTSSRAQRIVVIGAEGHVGTTICAALPDHHDVIKVGRNSGDVNADISERSSIDAMYKEIGKVDAVVLAAGAVHFCPLEQFPEDKFLFNLTHKAMGQINCVLAGLNYLNDGGSFTLSSGILDRDPIRMASGAAAANGAIGGFVKSAAIEMPRDTRINVVSTGLQDISVERYGSVFPGHTPVSSERVANAYLKCVEGGINGQLVTVD
ncbi:MULTISPECIES: short chain dehydrogenase [unclassified Pseudovibrio]|uniref:short chain dehydrogenase n=1 Tax=unclassified Pseudovibrio TaxID=2627060 RepID=UPI0007B272CE|nr:MULTISPECIES: short chain dehydrogenase [unclassified Pseudovibrio]KZK97331.1 short chain dehydrogenase [Pseudovibrio sp. W74]KZL10283.1 short chain dehydrogenase [Pseudovibrio sp. Ad14]